MFTERFRTDRRGGIEGLPLQLMIVILVATMGTAIIVGWMGNIETPQSIGDIDVPDGLVHSDSGTIASLVIEVRDQDGNYLPDAVVVFTDNYVTMTDPDGGTCPASATTDSGGRAVFSNVHVDAPGSASTAILEILVYKSGYGEKTTDIMVLL